MKDSEERGGLSETHVSRPYGSTAVSDQSGCCLWLRFHVLCGVLLSAFFTNTCLAFCERFRVATENEPSLVSLSFAVFVGVVRALSQYLKNMSLVAPSNCTWALWSPTKFLLLRVSR